MVYGDILEEIRRLYDPTDDLCSRAVPLEQLVVFDTEKHVSHLRMRVVARPSPVTNTRSLVVHIDGACRGNGTPTARPSYGVFFGEGSPYNTYGLLPSNLPQTSTRAEIEALS